MTHKAKIVLIEPGDVFEGKPYPPISLLTLVAAMSGRDDVACEIVDYRIGQTVEAFIPDPAVVAFGISSRTGDCLASAVSVARKIKARRPDAPVIWGGVHATCVPDETAREPFVDIVVRGDGEETLGEVITALVRGEAFDTVRGIVFKRQDRVVSTPGREPANLGRLPPLPYEMLDLTRYERDILWMNTSRGCPYSCQFCCNAIDPGFRSAMPPDLVVEHLCRYKRLLEPASAFFGDYNFFADRERVLRIASGLVEAGAPIEWGAYIVAADACRLEEADLRLLRASGCTYLISGQDAARELMPTVRKPSTHEHVDAAIRRVSRAGILSVTNYIIGLPGESRADLLSVVDDMRARDARYGQPSNVFIFFAWPGTPIVSRLRAMHVEVARGMDAWSNVMLGDASRLRFLQARHRRLVQSIYYVTSLVRKQPVRVFSTPHPGRFFRTKTALLRALEHLCTTSALVRWRRGRFSWGVEWLLLHALARTRHALDRRRMLRASG
jgi:anaerobic magnesium-protoporphyrin IX monomethyl ester cyclase